MAIGSLRQRRAQRRNGHSRSGGWITSNPRIRYPRTHENPTKTSGINVVVHWLGTNQTGLTQKARLQIFQLVPSLIIPGVDDVLLVATGADSADVITGASVNTNVSFDPNPVPGTYNYFVQFDSKDGSGAYHIENTHPFSVRVTPGTWDTSAVPTIT